MILGGTGEESGNYSFSINCTLGVIYDNFMLSRQRENGGEIILVEFNAESKGTGMVIEVKIKIEGEVLCP